MLAHSRRISGSRTYHRLFWQYVNPRKRAVYLGFHPASAPADEGMTPDHLIAPIRILCEGLIDISDWCVQDAGTGPPG